MDIISFNEAATANERIERFNASPDSNYGILTQPKVIGAGETVRIESGRQAVLADMVVRGDLVIEAGADVLMLAGEGYSKLVGERLDALDSSTVKLTGDQIISGAKTFASSLKVPSPIDNNDVANKQYVDAYIDRTKLDGIEEGATADQTAEEIKIAYESNADTNALTDSLLTLLTTNKVKDITTDALNNKLVITYTDDTVANLDMNDIITDVHVSGAELDATTNTLILTSSVDGADVVVNLSDYVTSGSLTTALDNHYTKDESDTNFEPKNENIQSHISSTENPHGVTKAQVGLENVDNTSDLDKPISTATQSALDLKADDDVVVKLIGDETVEGIKTFTSSPIVPTPTEEFQVATKEYVDAHAGGGVGSSDLVSLSDVALGIIEDGDSLVYDSATGKWVNKTATAGGTGITYTQSTTEPLDPAEGDEWFDLNEGVLYKRVSDGTSHIWLDITGASYSNVAGLKYVWEDESSRNLQADIVIGNQGFQKDNYTVYEYSAVAGWFELYKTSPDVVSGKSAYQSYLDTTTDDPKMSEAEWIDSLNGGAGLTEDDQAKLDKIETIETKIEDIEEELTEIYTKDDINSLLQDTNVEGLSTLSSPKLNTEVLTEFRHPVSGKPIYTKTIDFGALPNNTTKNVAHGVVNTEEVWIDESRTYVRDSAGTTFPISFPHPTNIAWVWYSRADKTNVTIVNGADRTTYTAIVTILYTKTTDTSESPVRKVGGDGNSSGGFNPDEDIVLSAGKGVVMTSENGTMYKLYIDNDGRLTTEAI